MGKNGYIIKFISHENFRLKNTNNLGVIDPSQYTTLKFMVSSDNVRSEAKF